MDCTQKWLPLNRHAFVRSTKPLFESSVGYQRARARREVSVSVRLFVWARGRTRRAMVCAVRTNKIITMKSRTNACQRHFLSGKIWSILDARACVLQNYLKERAYAYATWLSVKARVRMGVGVRSFPPNERYDRFVERTDRFASRLDNLPTRTRKNEAEVVRTRRRRNLAAKSKRNFFWMK